MCTIGEAHKASVICKQLQDGKTLHLNTDGTTLAQRKINGIAINDKVISINEIHDGTAETVINDVSKQLQKLREMAFPLNLPNANSINWTLISSSSSDSAAAQKKLNKLIQQCQSNDQKQFGYARPEGISLIESFCAMHLGCNLRKAFLDGMKNGQSNDGSTREYYAVDTFVYEFCKLFGNKGTPEYGSGVLNFPDFLSLMHSKKSTTWTTSYYEACSNIILERQVGNRYFVTAANAGKVFFLKEAAKHFIEYTGKDNRLEKELYRKLQDAEELALLKADALMFFHIYADLVMLAKSSVLEKSVVDMSTHYLELKMFLKELSAHPEVAMDHSYHAFRSESRLYMDNIKTNHRLHSKSVLIHQNLFQSDNLDDKVFDIKELQ